ncbi:MAG: outer membrane beta-barrel protein [Candidatus Paceibacterota bacterium]
MDTARFLLVTFLVFLCGTPLAANADTAGWKGGYVSLSINAVEADEKNSQSADTLSGDGSAWGIQVGYRGGTPDPRVIWGVELATESGFSSDTRREQWNTETSEQSFDFRPTVDLRGKVGMTFLEDDNLLLYVFAGASSAKVKRFYQSSSPHFPDFKESRSSYAFGYLVGAGVAYKLSDRWRIGAEYLSRNLGIKENRAMYGEDTWSSRQDIQTRGYALRVERSL